jgi:DNA polymerase III delta' subunit
MITKPLGHKDQIDSLLSSIKNQKLHQSLLFVGPSGIGKKTIAQYVGAVLLCEAEQSVIPCGKCESCLLNAVRNHPDLFSFSPSIKEESSVEALRNLLSRLSLRPFRGKAKVVIIDAADEFSIAASNIFLKTLEEPRPNLYFILITENPSRLPITIRSRTQRWEFAALSNEDLSLILIDRMSKKDDTYTIDPSVIHYADGSLTHIKLIKEAGSAIDEFLTWIDVIIKGQVTESLSYIPLLVKDKNELPTKLQLLLLLVRFKMRTLVLSNDSSDRYGQARLAFFLSDLITSQHVLFDRNINSLMVLTSIILKATGAEPQLIATAAQESLFETISQF